MLSIVFQTLCLLFDQIATEHLLNHLSKIIWIYVSYIAKKIDK